MGGACGRGTAVDAWTPIPACTTARLEGADSVNAMADAAALTARSGLHSRPPEPGWER
jgi:hypothetical protein